MARGSAFSSMCGPLAPYRGSRRVRVGCACSAEARREWVVWRRVGCCLDGTVRLRAVESG
eukprot:3493734-Rhodomonas_salina.1